MAENIRFIMPILEPFLKELVNKIRDQVSYLCCYRCNVKSLSDEIRKLEVETATLQRAVDAAERKLEAIRPDVEDWLRRANDTETTSRRVLSEADDIRKLCLSKRCPILHYSLSREAKTTTAAAVELRNTGKFETVSNSANPQDRLPIPAASVIDFNSRVSLEREIMDALLGNSVYLIGLCGMGGIGKTTMAKNIRSKAKMTSMFEIVAFAVVSQTPSPERVQKQIAEEVGLPLEEDNLQIRAEKLHASLKKAKSFLIILDDVWKEIDLENLGIPSKSSHERGKIIMTSRVRDALPLTEDAKITTMDILTDKEAWNLFREKSGYSDDGSVPCETAKAVAKQCKGLPLALVVVGSALRNKSEPSWKDALRQLERNIPPSNTPQVLQQLYIPLKWSYDQLQSEDARYIFLLCCLFPEDHEIPLEILVRYGWGLRIFSGIENMREARDRIFAMVEMLKFRFLLIDVEREYDNNDGGYVKMHDVVRDMAISIASKDRYVFLLNDERNKWPEKDSYENYTHISVKLKANYTLPEDINCPRLEFLHVEFDQTERGFLENFFASRGGLKVLSVVFLNILSVEFLNKSLPSSTCQLTNLRVLHLDHYTYGKLGDQVKSLFDRLVNLEILSLSRFQLEELPKEIGQLKKLKLLELTNCVGLVNIAPGVISGLVQLEELALVGCGFNEWEAEEEGKERRNASLAEVASLRNLVTLKIKIKNPKLLSLDLPNEPKLGAFDVKIGKFDLLPYWTSKYKKVIVCECKEVTLLGNFFQSMIRNHVECLYLEGDGCIGIVNELAAEGFQEVKELHLSDCNNVEYLMEPKNVVSFAALESLSLKRSRCLKGISWLDPPPIGSFGSLTHLKLADLPGFTQAFPLSESLSQLEDLHISHCPLEAVFKEGEEVDIIANNKIKFLKLRKLELYHLPSLQVFCKGIESIEFPALEDLVISDLPKMTNFCLTKCNQSQQFLFNKEILCTNLKCLRLCQVNSIVGIFNSGTSKANFSWLLHLRVQYCQELKEIIAPEEGQGGPAQTTETLFPQLMELQLRGLPKFQRFCHMKNKLVLPSLHRIEIADCEVMETFSLGSLHLPNLRSVHGIQNPDRAMKFFYNNEKSSEEIHTDNNCFILSVRELSFTCPEEDRPMFLIPDSSDSFVPAVKLSSYNWLEVNGRFMMAKLSQEEVYEIFYVLMLDKSAYDWKHPVNFQLTLPEGITHHRTETLDDMPREEWLEILVGEFRVEPNQTGDLEFSLYQLCHSWKDGLLIKGVMIRPKFK